MSALKVKDKYKAATHFQLRAGFWLLTSQPYPTLKHSCLCLCWLMYHMISIVQ